MSVTALSIVEIIESGRWRRAVFTSFTLSLTYFECYILPRLRARGCSKIDIYVDELGYRDSLVESRSRHAGRDYTVHPVAVKGGIFHPKLTYLWSEQEAEDVLLVGSGNLTYAGHGGSLEVFELLRPTLHATAFGQAATFFGQLAHGSLKRVNVGTAQSPLAELGQRIAALSIRYPNIEEVEFVHSLTKSGLAQLTDKLVGQDFEQLLVMSPYHNPDGDPIKQLVDATKPETLLVAVDLRKGTSPFPFKKTSSWNCEVEAVAAIDTKNRIVHAKWYEWRAADYAITFTGSFNATTESLGSISNVECGVLRRMSAASDGWKEVEPLPFKKQTFPRNGANGELLVAAVLKGRTLEGCIFGHTATAATEWSFTLYGGDREQTQLQHLSVASDGTFDAALEMKVDSADDSAIQISMDCGESSARGWVALPYILGIAPQSRIILSTLGNVERGSESVADFASLVTIVMSEIDQLNAAAYSTTSPSQVPQGDKKASKAAGAVTTAPDPGVDPRAEVADDSLSRAGNSRDRVVQMMAEGKKGWAVLGALAKLLLGSSSPGDNDKPSAPAGIKRQGPAKPIAHVDDEDDDDETDAELATREKEEKKLQKALEDFEAMIARCRKELNRRVVAHDSSPADIDVARLNLANLECTWLHVMLRACVGPLRDVKRAHFELEEWMHRIVYTRFNGPAFDMILAEYSGCAAVLAYRNAEHPGALLEAVANRRAPEKNARSAQYLEAAFNGAPDIELVLLHASAWLESQVGFALVDGETDAALDALRAALELPTPRKLVAKFLSDLPAQVIAPDWWPLTGDLLQLLTHAAKRQRRMDAAKVVSYHEYSAVDLRAIGACNLCGQALGVVVRGARTPEPSMLAQLKLCYVAPCPKCHKPLINSAAIPK